jgi:hypothetical protein
MTPAAQRAVESSSRLITKLRSLLRTGQGGSTPYTRTALRTMDQDLQGMQAVLGELAEEEAER